VNSNSLVTGRTYYRLTFVDRDLTMPGLEPFVFIGSHEDEGGLLRFAFQDAESYVTLGSAIEYDLSEDDSVFVLLATQDEIPALVLELDEAAQEIAKASIRWSALGSPKLVVLRD
jgi:hypothetical protein